MLDKELFFSLCEKYNVELSKTAKTPIIPSLTVEKKNECHNP